MEYLSIFEQLPDLVICRDNSRKIIKVNPAFTSAFGQSPSDWVGKQLDGSVSGAQIGAFNENRAYGHICIQNELHWVEWIEIKSKEGGSLAIGRLNPDRRRHQRAAATARLERRKNKAPPHQLAIGQRPAAPAALPAMRVLLAEDDLLNAKLAIALLERSGCVVTHVETGKQAIEEAKTKEFDLVFMDIRMPEMDGLSATRAIRALGGSWSQTPIVALTANAFAEDKTACHAAGMDGFLTKPISIDALDAARKRWTARPKQVKII